MASSSSSIVSGSLRTNYARIGHAAQQLFPDILQELITIKEPAQRLSHDVHKNNYLSKNLRPDEWVMINDVVTKGYANFDISLIYKLIRNLNLVPRPTKWWDYCTAPSPTEVTTGDDIERIRRFRNEKLHKGNAQVTDTELSQFFSEFKDIAGRLETYMGKQTGEFVDKFVDLETCCMDEKTSEIYIKRIERLRKSDEDCKKRIHAVEKDVDALKKESTSQTEGFEKTTKQVDKLKSKEEVRGKEIKDLQVNQRGQTEKLKKTAKKVDALELKEEVHGKEIKDLQVNQQGQIEELENTTKQLDALELKEEVHGKEIEDLQVNQRDYFLGYVGGFNPKNVKRREIDKISLPESFEKIKEVNKGSDALRDNGIVILVGIKGSGKSTIGKAIIKQFCENTDYDMIQLSTTTNSDCCDGSGFFSPRCSKEKVVVFLDDLFGRVPSIYALKEHIMLLKWVHERKDVFEIKILSTVQAETKACVEELFASDALLKSAEIINLHTAIYPRRDMLIKSGIDEERSDIIIRQIKETGVLERIGFPALVSIYKENQELGDELFINPGNVFMEYLSSLKEGSDHDKMYFVILIHVLMTGKVYETQNASDNQSMCHIATTMFGNTFKFQNYYFSIESIIDEKEDGILMNKNPYYCFKDEITPDFIFQYYKEEAFKKDYTKEEFEMFLTTCSLNCIVNYFRPLTDTPDELLFCIDSSLYQSIASHIMNIIQKDIESSKVLMSVKSLCMSPLIQEESFLRVLMFECHKLDNFDFFPTGDFRLGYDKIVGLKASHFASLLLYQSCRQLILMKEENVEVVKIIFQKVCEDSRKENEEICQTINKLVQFSMEELCKENNDKNVVLELLWKFIKVKKVDCEYNEFLMNAWRYQCSEVVTWLQENVREPNYLQMDQCFFNIFPFIGVHKTSWILERNPTSGQNRISMYKVFNKVLKTGKRPLMRGIWQFKERILEDYKQLQAIKSTANLKNMFANRVIEIALKEICLTSTAFEWAYDTFKPHTNYFDKTMIKKIERENNRIKK